MLADLDEQISESCTQEWYYRVDLLYKNREACVQIRPKACQQSALRVLAGTTNPLYPSCFPLYSEAHFVIPFWCYFIWLLIFSISFQNSVTFADKCCFSAVKCNQHYLLWKWFLPEICLITVAIANVSDFYCFQNNKNVKWPYHAQ